MSEIRKKPKYEGQRLDGGYMHAPGSLLGATKTKTISSCHAKTNATASEII